MTDNASVAERIAELVSDLPNSQVEKIAAALSALPAPTPAGRHRIDRLVPTARFRAKVGDLWEAWTKAPAWSGPSIGLAIRAASSALEAERDLFSLTPVWTGPSSYRIPVRQTREVLLDVINAATRLLYVVSFAAYKVQSVVDALESACSRGVEVRLILEPGAEQGGKLKHAAADAFQQIAEIARFYIWPPDTRPPNASMHAKAAIADGSHAFVTSANVTESGVTGNMELGVLIHGGRLPQDLSDHFTQLIELGQLSLPA